MIKCKVCNDQGFEIKVNVETKERVAYPCECRLRYDEQDLFRKRLIASDIPVEYWNYTVESYKELPFPETVHERNAENLKTLQLLMQAPADLIKKHSLIWIWGAEAVAGHTTLSVILASELLKEGYKVKFLLMQNLVDMFTDFDEKKEYFRSLEEIDVFLLDSAFLAHTCVAKEYALIHLYNWLLKMLTREKFFICNSKVSIPNITDKFKQCKQLIAKYATSLEFQGSILNTLLNALE
jgi:hypothetical protein